jgi:hypothetical protein
MTLVSVAKLLKIIMYGHSYAPSGTYRTVVVDVADSNFTLSITWINLKILTSARGKNTHFSMVESCSRTE